MRHPVRQHPALAVACLALATALVLQSCQDAVEPPGPEMRRAKVDQTLTITGAGSGSGKVTAPEFLDQPALECSIVAGTYDPITCSQVYPWKAVIELTAIADPGSALTWGGACSGTGPTCRVVMARSREVRVTFSGQSTPSYALQVAGAGTGDGTVASGAGTDPAVACTITAGTGAGDCGGSYLRGTVVRLGATPGSGSTFHGWSGACTGTGSCEVTVTENLAFPLEVRRLAKSEIEAKIKRALDMVKLAGFGNRRPGQLSGGQQQRVALARALVFEPKLVLMDEPLGALDKQLREHMQLEVKHIHRDLGVTVVYVTHDQSEALTMSDRIAVFNDGEIQQLATPDDLYERPQNSFVAQFIGENNRLQGTVVAVNGTACHVEVDGAKVEALPIRIGGPGAPTTLSLRPERVKLNPVNGACSNVFSGRVEELIYLGDHTRVRASVCGNNDFVIKVPNSEGVPSLTPGANITVGWKKEDCRALDAF